MPNPIVGLELTLLLPNNVNAWTKIDTYECGVWDILINMEQEGLIGHGTCNNVIYSCQDWGNSAVSCDEIASMYCTEIITYQSAKEIAKNVFDISYASQEVCENGCEPGHYIDSISSCQICPQGYYSDGYTTMCTECPTHTASNTAGQTDIDNPGYITSCYIPPSAKWTFSDTKGSGTQSFSSNCYYN